MQLVQKVTPAVAEVIKYAGVGNFIVVAGKHFVIETGPGGEDILDATVPAGKTWTVRIELHVDEV